jgi:Trypsin-like peptidase domain
MKNNILKLSVINILSAILLLAFTVSAQSKTDSTADSVVTIITVSGGVETSVGSGIVVGADGYILTPLHILKNADQISVKLRNGEIFDNAVIANKDERRNIALLRIIAGSLKVLPTRSSEEISGGAGVSIVSNSAVTVSGTLNGMPLADGITGAGSGYRLFLFETKATDNLVGGLLLDEQGRSIGIVTTNPNVKQQNIAVPFSTISGLLTIAKPDSQTKSANETAVEPKTTTTTTTTKESAKKGGRVTAREVLKTAQTIYVHSKTSFIQDPAFIAELMKNTDFNSWDWSFTNDRENADLILEVDRLPWVIKFTFKVYSIKHGVIIASGNVHTNDFNYGSPDMVNEVIKRLKLEFALAK